MTGLPLKPDDILLVTCWTSPKSFTTFQLILSVFDSHSRTFFELVGKALHLLEDVAEQRGDFPSGERYPIQNGVLLDDPVRQVTLANPLVIFLEGLSHSHDLRKHFTYN